MILSNFCFATILSLIICVEVNLIADRMKVVTNNCESCDKQLRMQVSTLIFLRVVPTPSSLHNPKSYFNFNPTSTHCGIHMWAQHVSLCPICCITEMARYAVGTISTEQLCTQPLPEIKPYKYLCFLCDIFLVYWIYCYMEPANYNLVLKYVVWQALFRLWLYTRKFIVSNFHWIKGDSTNTIVFH